MENALVSLSANELYITHAEYQGCFIKIWANFYSKKQVNVEKCLQDYNNYTKEFHKLDLSGKSLYVYIYRIDSELRVYRCQILNADLVAKTFTIILIDYGRKMVVPYLNVREVISNIDPSLLINLSQRATIYTFFLSGYLSKPRSNDELIKILCHKYYKYRRDFEIGGITFVSLYGVDKNIVDRGAANTIDIASMITISKTMASTISLMNKNDLVYSCPIPSKAPSSCTFLKSQVLDYINLVDVIVTQVSSDNSILMLKVHIIDNESEVLSNMLNSLDRQNLKLAPVLEVYTPCLIIFCNKLVRAVILKVEIDKLYVDLVDYGRREFVPRASVFEIPHNCKLLEMRSLDVVLDKPNNMTIDINSFIHHYYKMMPLKIDPNFGLYKVKLYEKKNEVLVDVCNSSVNNIDVDHYSVPSISPDFFSITEINEEIKSIENSKNCEAFSNSPHNDQVVEENLKNQEISHAFLKDQKNVQLNHDYKVENKDINLNENVNSSTEYNEENGDLINEELQNIAIPIMFLEKETLIDREFFGKLISYKSPHSFRVRRHDANFVTFMDNIKSISESRKILVETELVKNMYVIYQNESNCIHRAQIIDMDSDIKNIKLRLIDEGDVIVNKNFEDITLYNFIESDCELPEQLVLECSLSNMWFPVMTVDTTFILQPFFNQELLYLVKVIEKNESGVNLVQLVVKKTNIDISNCILESGIGQRLCAAMKTDETLYEENLFKGQRFLSYVYFYHFKVYIQPEPNTVDELEEEILEFVNNNSNPRSLDVHNLQGTYCLATVNNGQWYRAYISNVNGDTAIVNMFDIGLLVNVPLNQVQSIPSHLMRKPQLCLPCILEADLDIKITEKKLYCVTVKSINTNGILCVTIEEQYTPPLFNPIVRGFENILSVHVDGDWIYLQRSQDTLKVEKLSKTISNVKSKLKSESCITPGNIYAFESNGKYYRCLVKSISSKMAVVLCVDFGFEKQVEMKNLLSLNHSKLPLLPANVIAVKAFPMAIKMSKSPMFLAHFFIDNNGSLSVLPNKTYSIDSHSELKKALENGCSVKVTCVYSSDECWVVPDLFFDTLKTISNALITMKSKITPDETEVGSLCAALHSKTKLWLRALILNEDSETENMLSIDSGERFKALKCSKMISEIQKIPNCALRCHVVSNVDVETLLNKNVYCKLISCSKPLLEVQLATENFTSIDVITSTDTALEWKVAVETFISFNEFYVIKTSEKYCLDSVNSKNLAAKKNFAIKPLVETLPNGGYAETLASHDTESIQKKMFYEKLYYRCCLVDDIKDDDIINDPNNLPIISNLMMTRKWMLKTSSDKEPYKVTLTADGQNCIDIVHEFLSSIDNTISEYTKLPKTGEKIETNIMSVKENGLHLPEVETVTLKYVETFRYFYVESNSLSILYMQRINSELDMCVVELSLNDNLIGSIVVTNSNQLNGIWCRAKVEKILTSNKSAYCYLLDYGSYEECSTFYKPTDFLYICPPLVRRCSLHAPTLDGKEGEIWYPNVDEMFKDVSTIGNGEFTMSIITDGDPCSVCLWLDNDKVSDLLFPMFVQLLYVNSLTDFKAIALSCKQKAVFNLLESGNISIQPVKNPIVGHLYLTEIKSKLKRVQLDSLGGIKYVVLDIDDTLDALSVPQLYEIPESIRDFPIFTLPCSLIFNKEEESTYSLSWFQKLAKSKVTFIMCVITESDGESPNLVRLYLDNKDILDMIKLST